MIVSTGLQGSNKKAYQVLKKEYPKVIEWFNDMRNANVPHTTLDLVCKCIRSNISGHAAVSCFQPTATPSGFGHSCSINS